MLVVAAKVRIGSGLLEIEFSELLHLVSIGLVSDNSGQVVVGVLNVLELCFH